MRFRKKLIVGQTVECAIVEAVLWDGDNIEEIMKLMDPHKPVHVNSLNPPLEFLNADDIIGIQTTDGLMIAKKGDWIMKGGAGRFYPCKPDALEEFYAPVTEEKNNDAATAN